MLRQQWTSFNMASERKLLIEQQGRNAPLPSLPGLWPLTAFFWGWERGGGAGGEREGGKEGTPKEGGLGCMEDALKPQTSVAEQLQPSVGEHGFATTTPADSQLQLLL